MTVLCFGLGYSARALGRRLLAEGVAVSGTARAAEGLFALARDGYGAMRFTGTAPGPLVPHALSTATHLVISAPPGSAGDPVLTHHAADIRSAPRLQWIGYLSTIGVYGDRDGAWVDEDTPPAPSSERSRQRLAAEQAWQALGRDRGIAVAVFRIAGIYGPGRSQLESVRDGTARRIVKPGQVFNRVHVEDIAAIVHAAMAKPRMDAVYNCADNAPAPAHEVITFAAQLLGVTPPPEVLYDSAAFTPMGRSFYEENKRVSSAKTLAELGVSLAYLDYRAGLSAIYAESAFA